MSSQEWLDKDFYKTLGVSKSSTEDDIKKAYRKLARKLHPDANPGDTRAEEKFKEVSEAYAVLSDKEQRKQYDAIRAMGSGARFSAGAGGPGGTAGFEDLFGGMFNNARTRQQPGAAGPGGIPPQFQDLFGGGFGYQAPSKGADINARTTISFKNAINGSKVQLRRPDGETVTVRIPAGVQDGQKIRIRGKGHPGPNEPGDLVVSVTVSPHPVFTRSGKNLRVTLPITFPEAALGTEVTVPTITGNTVRLRIPAGTPSGRTLRVKGHGVSAGNSTGDLLVTVEVAVPSRLTDEAKKAVEAFAEATSDAPDPRADLYAKAEND